MSGFDSTTHLIYLACATCFVIGPHLMNAPATARRGNQLWAGVRSPRRSRPCNWRTRTGW